MYTVLLFIYLGGTTLPFVKCFSDGNFDGNQDVCQSMAVDHDGLSNQDPASNPFTVDPDYIDVTVLGTVVNVSLTANSVGRPFRGFMLEARETNDGPPVGVFSLLDSAISRLQSCNGTAGRAVTQTANQDKTEVRVLWSAPNTGRYFFRATFVENFETFWARKDISPPTTTTTSTTTTSSTPFTTTSASALTTVTSVPVSMLQPDPTTVTEVTSLAPTSTTLGVTPTTHSSTTPQLDASTHPTTVNKTTTPQLNATKPSPFNATAPPTPVVFSTASPTTGTTTTPSHKDVVTIISNLELELLVLENSSEEERQRALYEAACRLRNYLTSNYEGIFSFDITNITPVAEGYSCLDSNGK
ncbi:cell wall protein DAN4-like [Colossoma macropomum]|uniref:cell wall protein DAN4-like n=1 Tax=Colossoma macropomum TaxID=42526 RepID=UPI001864849D|nr:cell wall protein DAN4-like [Colossoma macropomum]